MDVAGKNIDASDKVSESKHKLSVVMALAKIINYMFDASILDNAVVRNAMLPVLLSAIFGLSGAGIYAGYVCGPYAYPFLKHLLPACRYTYKQDVVRDIITNIQVNNTQVNHQGHNITLNTKNNFNIILASNVTDAPFMKKIT